MSLRVGVGHGRSLWIAEDLENRKSFRDYEDIVYDRRVRVIEYAARINNVSEACRVFGVSRKAYYEWVSKAEQYGLSALLPRERRRPHQPNAMTFEEVAVILSEAIARPTLGPKSLLRHLKKRDVDRVRPLYLARKETAANWAAVIESGRNGRSAVLVMTSHLATEAKPHRGSPHAW